MSWTCAWCRSTDHLGVDCPDRPKHGSRYAVLAPGVDTEPKGARAERPGMMEEWLKASVWVPASDWPVLTYSSQGFSVARYDAEHDYWGGDTVDWWMPIPDPPPLSPK